MEASEYIDIVGSIHGRAKQSGLQFQIADAARRGDRMLDLHGRTVHAFTSCSYLGLEFHPNVIEASIAATVQYGTQFSSSRGYVAAPLYREVQAAVDAVFGGHVVLGTSTTLAHQMALPVIATERDAIVIDNQAHRSVHDAVVLAQARGAHVEVVRHWDFDERAPEVVERLARERRQRGGRVYVAVDGVYSMYGDCAPMGLLRQLLDIAPNVRLYIDDAHGVSWAGERGQGWALDQLPFDERIVVAGSLSKGFGAGGGFVAFADAEEAERVRLCGGSYGFSGPIQMPVLGAILGSARVHLSGELQQRQRLYHDRVRLTNEVVDELGLPLLVRNESPIFFLRVGKVAAAQDLVRRVLDDGYYLNVSNFPTVPLKRAGVRFTITAIHTEAEIRGALEALAHHYPLVLAEHGITPDDLDDLYANAVPKESRGGIDLTRKSGGGAACGRAVVDGRFDVEEHDTIHAVDEREWNALMSGHGASRWATLAMAERLTSGQDRPEYNWLWRYLIVRDAAGTAVGATYVTRCRVKDDMFAREEISEAAERRRALEPYALTSIVTMTGSLMSEGAHMHLPAGELAQPVRERLLAEIERIAAEWDTEAIVLRDFPADDAALEKWMHEHDWVKQVTLHTHALPLTDFADETLLARSGRRTRRFLRGLMERAAEHTVQIWPCGAGRSGVPATWVDYLDRLYRNVAERKLRINDFGLPPNGIAAILDCEDWEVITVHLAPEHGGPAGGEPVAWGAAYRDGDEYTPFLAGVDYDYVNGETYGSYRVLLLSAIRRAREAGASVVRLGMDADVEKQRFGTTASPCCMYTRSRRHDHGIEMQLMIQTLGLRASAPADAAEQELQLV